MIAAASILAKVERDRAVQALPEEFSMYGFDKHKGYGTAAHRATLGELGLCPQHRKGFCHL
jgi:ribonuclease HII